MGMKATGASAAVPLVSVAGLMNAKSESLAGSGIPELHQVAVEPRRGVDPAALDLLEADPILVPEALQLGRQRTDAADAGALQPVQQAFAVDVEHQVAAIVVVQFGPGGC